MKTLIFIFLICGQPSYVVEWDGVNIPIFSDMDTFVDKKADQDKVQSIFIIEDPKEVCS